MPGDLSQLAVRPLVPGDVDQLADLAHDAIDRIYFEPGEFEPLDAAGLERGRARFARALGEDPGGGWGVDDPECDGALLGAAVSLRRGDLWFLSMFGVRPKAQGGGIGARLLAAAQTYADGATAGMLLASRDPKALRRYWRSGFALEPAYYGEGAVDRSAIPAGLRVEDGDLARDAELVDALDRAERGFDRRVDVAAMTAIGNLLLVVRPSGSDSSSGYVVVNEGVVRCLAASDSRTAARLLWAALASTPQDKKAMVEWVTARTPWAVDVVVESRLPLGYSGSLAVRGALGPMTSYLPSGAWG